MLGSMGRATVAAVAAVSLTLGLPALAADEQVDLELVLAVDVSGSMDRDEQTLQRAGYVAAIVHPEVIDAVRSGLTGRIAVTYMEWAGPMAQRIVVPWHVIDGPASAETFAATLDDAPLGTMRGTSISAGLALAATLFEDNGFEGLRRVIDISGDGANNMGPPVRPVRDELVSAGFVINGLPIMLKRGGGIPTAYTLDSYYAECVIGGAGAFLVAVSEPAGLVEAIRRKLVLEIADLSGETAAAAFTATPVANPDFDCMAGERARRMWMDR